MLVFIRDRTPASLLALLLNLLHPLADGDAVDLDGEGSLLNSHLPLLLLNQLHLLRLLLRRLLMVMMSSLNLRMLHLLLAVTLLMWSSPLPSDSPSADQPPLVVEFSSVFRDNLCTASSNDRWTVFSNLLTRFTDRAAEVLNLPPPTASPAAQTISPTDVIIVVIRNVRFVALLLRIRPGAVLLKLFYKNALQLPGLLMTTTLDSTHPFQAGLLSTPPSFLPVRSRKRLQPLKVRLRAMTGCFTIISEAWNLIVL